MNHPCLIPNLRPLNLLKEGTGVAQGGKKKRKKKKSDRPAASTDLLGQSKDPVHEEIMTIQMELDMPLESSSGEEYDCPSP